MTAANHKIIIEKGATFKIDIQVSENGIVMKDLLGWTVHFALMHDVDGIVTEAYTQLGELVPDELSPDDAPDSPPTYLNGNITVKIDGSNTGTLATLVDPALDPFITEYNYFYHIDIKDGTDEIRVLRGKAAVRE